MAEQKTHTKSPHSSAPDDADPAKLALAWTHTARFLTTASQLDQLPVTELPEIAFVGRSVTAKLALAWTHTARFLTTASQLDQLPVTELPEIAFVGRSNAGKSTAINVLTQQKRLAFASKTPGRTQHINLFELGPKLQANALFADLPGYGYAAVARGAKLRWQKVMADYLNVRRSLTGVVLMVDSRLGFTDLDRQLLAFVAPRLSNGAVKLLVLLTKADKLNRSESNAALAAAQAELGEIATDEADVGMVLFSALKKTGVDDAAQALHAWVPAAHAAPI